MMTSENTARGREKYSVEYFERGNWAPDVWRALNDFIAKNGSASPGYDPTVYAVFDFDNTTAIFDVEHQLIVWQLQRMAFAIRPEDMTETVLKGLRDPDEDLTGLGIGIGSYRDWAADIGGAYTRLYEAYGPFTPEGLDDETAGIVQRDPWWREFAAKMRALFALVQKHEPAMEASRWSAGRFVGMTERELYDLAYASHSYYEKCGTSVETWRSPEGIVSRTGCVRADWTCGVSVADDVKNLMRAFRDNGINVWICSASGIDVVRAGIDCFGLHGSVTGLLAMTYKKTDGRYNGVYDDTTGRGWLCAENGEWVRDTFPQNAVTKSAGKVTAIENALHARYGHGPAAGFMDNSGDFNLCTEYSSLQLVVCFNRALPLTDGGALIAEVALYQRDALHYDLDRANAAGDTLYVVQGRDENGLRSLRRSNGTVLAGSAHESIFPAGDSIKRLRYMSDNGMTTRDVINRFAIKTAADAPDNPIRGIAFGHLTDYRGYHSR